MKLRFKRPYSQAEITEQIGQVSKLMQIREKSPEKDMKRADTAVECAQEILNYMLIEVVDSRKN